jgi:hypothetical protein
MRETDPLLGKHVGQIPQTQRVAKAPENDQAHDIGRISEDIEECTGVLVKPTSTSATAKPAITQRCMVRKFSGHSRLTVRVSHRAPSFSGGESTRGTPECQGDVSPDRAVFADDQVGIPYVDTASHWCRHAVIDLR